MPPKAEMSYPAATQQERMIEAVTMPLDHALGFQLADVGPAAIKVLRQYRMR